MTADPSTTLDDLSFVQRALARDRSSPVPPSISVLWAVICAAGFLTNDFAPERAGLFWGIASPAGFLVSGWLGHRSARAGGELDRQEQRRWALHFGTLLVALLVAALGAFLGAFSGAQMGTIALLLCGAIFLLAGLHLARPLAWVGALMLAGVPAVLLVERWRWSLVGVFVTAALLVLAATGRRRRTDAAR